MASVLIADDIRLNRLLLERILLPRGFSTLTASNGQEAVSLARTWVPDLILMDIEMPELDGIQALTRLRALPATRNIPVIAVTGNVLGGSRAHLVQAGFNASIYKPFDIDQLLELVNRYTPDPGPH